MKTVTNGIEVRRVSNETARQLVESGEWTYCQKSVWKEIVRDAK